MQTSIDKSKSVERNTGREIIKEAQEQEGRHRHRFGDVLLLTVSEDRNSVEEKEEKHNNG
jgi:hypothetical protein